MRATATSFDAIVEETDWSQLAHAYATATDTPGNLRALARGKDAEAAAALEYLWATVLHQGTLYTATAPAARAVAALMVEAGEASPLRAELLDFLACVAESAQFEIANAELEAMVQSGDLSETDTEAGDELLDATYARAMLACREACRALLAVAR